MSFSSKPKKIRQKGTVQELKVVQTINRRGVDTYKAEEVKTPKKNKATSSSQNRSSHSSPAKRPKLDAFELEPILYEVEGDDLSKKRQTLVSFILFYS